MPESLRWDHNAHYHDYVMRQVHRRRKHSLSRVLDVGCGSGALARRLAAEAGEVDAVDVSAAMIEAARSASENLVNVRWILGDVLTLDLGADRYDAVTAMASLHHLPLDAGLQRLAALVAPGGVLVVIGLARPESAADRVLRVASAVLSAGVGLMQTASRRISPDSVMPVRDPAATLQDIRAAAARHLPGSTVRRLLFSRYSLVWRRLASA